MTVVEAVERDLADLKARDPRLAESALAATALALAKELDNDNSATSKSMCARALNETMAQLLALAPPAQAEDDIDELKQARETRREREARRAG